MNEPVPLIVPDARAAQWLDLWLEVAARSGARVAFEPLDAELAAAAAAERLGARGLGLSLDALDPPELLAALGAELLVHRGSELPVAFTLPRSGAELERGSPGAAALRRALPAGEDLLPSDSGIALGWVSTAGATRVADAAFAAAAGIGASLALVHRSSAGPATDGLFVHAARNVAVRHPDVEFQDLSFDRFAERAVRDRGSLGVLLGPPAAIDGALAVLAAVARVPRPPGVVVGRGGVRLHGVHGASGGVAALLRAGRALLEELGEQEPAQRLETALRAAALRADFERAPGPQVIAALRSG